MGQQTKIEWCDSTWNPWYCCREVSPGCDNCYARAWARRAGKPWGQPIKAAEKTFEAPLHWADPRKIFVCSLSDFFFDATVMHSYWQSEAAKIMGEASQHTYLIPTKRPQNILPALSHARIEAHWPWRSVWLGVTVENQDAVWRIEELAKIPAAIRWVSFEPLVGPVIIPDKLLGELDWIVIGGETDQGPKRARMMDADWLENLIAQADEAEIPVFFKQWGEWAPLTAATVHPIVLTAEIADGNSMMHYRVGRKHIIHHVQPREFPRQCRVCRCTERMACDDPIDGPCHWIAADLCSSCATEAACES